MQSVRTIGLDIAKSVFQVHGVDAEGQVVIRRRLTRGYVLCVLSEAVAQLIWYGGLRDTASLAGELQALGRTVRLMQPAYVKPHVERQKNHATDAETICEAVHRPTTVTRQLAADRDNLPR